MAEIWNYYLCIPEVNNKPLIFVSLFFFEQIYRILQNNERYQKTVLVFLYIYKFYFSNFRISKQINLNMWMADLFCLLKNIVG